MPGRPGVTPEAEDGSTLVLASSDAMVVAPMVAANAGEPPQSAACPLALVATTPHVLLVATDSSFDQLADFVAYARDHPGEVSYGTSEIGTAADLLGERFARAARIELTHTRYRTSAAAMHDVLGGDVAAMFGTLAAAMPAVREGRVRVLAVSSPARMPQLPDVPTFGEAGLPQLTSSTWYGLFMRCGLDADRAGPLYAAAREAIVAPDLAGALGARLQPVATPALGADFAASVHESASYWSEALALLHAAEH